VLPQREILEDKLRWVARTENRVLHSVENMRAIVDRIGCNLNVFNEDEVYRRDSRPCYCHRVRLCTRRWTMKHSPTWLCRGLRVMLGITIAGSCLLSTTPGMAQTVIDRMRLGNNVEDVTYITAEPFADHIAVLNGHEVYGVSGRSLNACGSLVVRKLFDLRRLGLQIGSRGFAYMQSERLFAVQDPAQRSTLFITDMAGEPVERRTIRYPDGFVPDHLEGLAYIPPSSPVFPDHLVLVAMVYGNPFDLRLEVMERDGTVVAEILPEAPVSDYLVTGVAYKAPDRLLVSSGDLVYTLDFYGNVVAGPAILEEEASIEGLVQLADGRVAAADYSTGRIFFFDDNLNRLWGDDRECGVGLDLSQPAGMAWDSGKGTHVISDRRGTNQLAELPQSLDARCPLVDLDDDGYGRPRQMTYLPNERLIAVSHGDPDAILLYDGSGTLVEHLDVSALGSPQQIAYIRPTREFAVRFSGEGSLLRILTRSGALVRTLDLSSIGMSGVYGVTYFEPTHRRAGELLLVDSQQAFVTNLNGDLIKVFDYREALGVLSPADVSTVSTRSLASPRFGMLDIDNSEIVVFELD